MYSFYLKIFRFIIKLKKAKLAKMTQLAMITGLLTIAGYIAFVVGGREDSWGSINTGPRKDWEK
tara:strand:- start:658 stop:849 length:192 start_codon:yes stop_codon:yes gene_type:complete